MLRAKGELMVTWYEVTGRDSGKPIEGIHVANTDSPYGQMTSGCGVVISSAFPVRFPRPWQHKCKLCVRVTKGTEQRR